ncbi:MAG TPA: hypothetical protein VMW80_14285 [Candidatus Dormibacteraeota bacterium]|nr:hypothetical protein [Candidatus Dormibacteraeota bacterium]
MSGAFSWYDLVMVIGLALTAIRMAVQYRVLKRVRAALGDALADVEKLKRKHPIDGTQHQAVYSPGQKPEVNP